jgi:hypothetical protein
MTNLMDINYRKEHMMMFYDTKSSIHYGFTQPYTAIIPSMGCMGKNTQKPWYTMF